MFCDVMLSPPSVKPDASTGNPAASWKRLLVTCSVPPASTASSVAVSDGPSSQHSLWPKITLSSERIRTDEKQRWWLRRASNWQVLLVKITAPQDGLPARCARFDVTLKVPVFNCVNLPAADCDSIETARFMMSTVATAVRRSVLIVPPVARWLFTIENGP